MGSAPLRQDPGPVLAGGGGHGGEDQRPRRVLRGLYRQVRHFKRIKDILKLILLVSNGIDIP